MGPVCAQRENTAEAASRKDSEMSYIADLAEGQEEQWIYAKRMKDESDEAFGKWVEERGPWQWFVTRTLRNPPHMDMGFSKVGLGSARKCLRDLLERTEATRVVAVFEMQEERGVPHLHALLGGCRAVDGNVEVHRDFQLWGIARWKAFKRDAGAPAYLGKYLGKDVVELYIGDNGPYKAEDLKGATLGGLRV